MEAERNACWSITDSSWWKIFQFNVTRHSNIIESQQSTSSEHRVWIQQRSQAFQLCKIFYYLTCE